MTSSCLEATFAGSLPGFMGLGESRLFGRCHGGFGKWIPKGEADYLGVSEFDELQDGWVAL